jgi:excisionase family DNA binding protein
VGNGALHPPRRRNPRKVEHKLKGYLTSQEAADRLGVTPGRIRQLIAVGRLPVERVGNTNLIKEEDLKLVAERKPGRPPKPQDDSNLQGSKKSKK